MHTHSCKQTKNEVLKSKNEVLK